jgi:hypothetical protein
MIGGELTGEEFWTEPAVSPSPLAKNFASPIHRTIPASSTYEIAAGAANSGGFGRLGWLAAQVVIWHELQLGRVSFGRPRCEPLKDQSRFRQAKAFGFLCGNIDLPDLALMFARTCHSCSSSKVRDEESRLCCRAAEETRSPTSETVESLRLLKAFLKLPSDRRSEVIEMIKRLATTPSPRDPLG